MSPLTARVTVSTRMMELATPVPYGVEVELRFIRATYTRTQIQPLGQQYARISLMTLSFTVKLLGANGSKME
jgi:hypothetical protein